MDVVPVQAAVVAGRVEATSIIPSMVPPPAVWHPLNTSVTPERDCVGPPVQTGLRVLAATVTWFAQTTSPRASARTASATVVTVAATVGVPAVVSLVPAVEAVEPAAPVDVVPVAPALPVVDG